MIGLPWFDYWELHGLGLVPVYSFWCCAYLRVPVLSQIWFVEGNCVLLMCRALYDFVSLVSLTSQFFVAYDSLPTFFSIQSVHVFHIVSCTYRFILAHMHVKVQVCFGCVHGCINTHTHTCTHAHRRAHTHIFMEMRTCTSHANRMNMHHQIDRVHWTSHICTPIIPIVTCQVHSISTGFVHVLVWLVCVWHSGS